MESIIVSPKDVKLKSQEDDLKGIAGLKVIKNIFKVINIEEYLDINEIGSTASHQSSRKSNKYALIPNPKFPASE